MVTCGPEAHDPRPDELSEDGPGIAWRASVPASLSSPHRHFIPSRDHWNNGESSMMRYFERERDTIFPLLSLQYVVTVLLFYH